MGAKGSVEAAKLNADNWGHLEVCTVLYLFKKASKQNKTHRKILMQTLNVVCVCMFMFSHNYLYFITV